LKALTNARNNLSVAAFSVKTAGCPLLTRTRKPQGKLATLEVRHSIASTGFCRVGEKGLNLGMADFSLHKYNMKNNLKSVAIATEEPAKLSELGLVVLTQLYDDITARNYEEATGLLEGLGELIEHNPALQPEARAMRQIAESERVLNSLRARKYAL
jgi:hypothetical protein